jgi:hypothetical protein
MEGEVLGPLKEISDEEFREILRKTYGVQDEKTLDFFVAKTRPENRPNFIRTDLDKLHIEIAKENPDIPDSYDI